MSNSYAILRHGKISLQDGKWSNVGKADGHNRRLDSQEVQKSYSKEAAAKLETYNRKSKIDSSRTKYNESIIGPDDRSDSLRNRLKKYLDSNDVEIKRKDSCVLEELVVTTSPGWWGDWKSQIDTPEFKEKLKTWRDKSMAFFQNKYGDKILQADLHLDETTPHIHILVVPLQTLDNGKKLNVKEVFSPKECNTNQTDYANAVADLGLIRGKEGSKAKHVHFSVHAKHQEEIKEAVQGVVVKANKNIRAWKDGYNALNEKFEKLQHDYDKLSQYALDLSKENEELKRHNGPTTPSKAIEVPAVQNALGIQPGYRGGFNPNSTVPAAPKELAEDDFAGRLKKASKDAGHGYSKGNDKEDDRPR